MNNIVCDDVALTATIFIRLTGPKNHNFGNSKLVTATCVDSNNFTADTEFVEFASQLDANFQRQQKMSLKYATNCQLTIEAWPTPLGHVPLRMARQGDTRLFAGGGGGAWQRHRTLWVCTLSIR